MIELIVVLGVVGVLVGLLLPAVQAARESARRARCAAHLKELALSCHSFATTFGGFPPSWSTHITPTPNGRTVGIGTYSTQCQLLPFLEQQSTYNALNFDFPSLQLSDLVPHNTTTAGTMIDAFLCPSDPRAVATGDGFAVNSYRACFGSNSYRVSLGDEPDGAITSHLLPLSAITDGLSNTLMFSEKPVGSGKDGPYSSFRDWVALKNDSPAWNPAPSSGAVDGWVQICSRLTVADLAGANLDGGRTWIIGGCAYTLFYTSAPPDSTTPDCGSYFGIEGGVSDARSYHPGGVNAALADGSVRWFSSSIARQTWSSLGTRAAGDPAF